MAVPGIWYHGSTKIFDRFALPPKYSPNEQLGFGIHFAQNKEFAELYGNVIYRCQLRPRKVFNMLEMVKVGSEKDLTLGKDFFKGTGRKPYCWDREDGKFYYLNPDMRPAKKAEEIFRKNGYDAIFYEAKYGTRTFNGHQHGANYTHQTQAVVMLDGSRVKIIDYTGGKKQ